jgi:hypothetical protein
MNLRRGLIRVWAVASGLWVLGLAFDVLTMMLRPYRFSAGEMIALPAIFLGPPMVVLSLGEGAAWAWDGFRTREAGGSHYSAIRLIWPISLTLLLLALGAGGVWVYTTSEKKVIIDHVDADQLFRQPYKPN